MNKINSGIFPLLTLKGQCVQTVAQLSCCIVNTYGRFGHAKFALICGCSFCKTWLNLAQTTLLRYVKYVIFEILLFSFLWKLSMYNCTYLLFYIIDHPDCTEKITYLNGDIDGMQDPIPSPLLCTQFRILWFLDVVQQDVPEKSKNKAWKGCVNWSRDLPFWEFLPEFSSAHFQFRLLNNLRWEFQAWPPLTIWLDELMYPFYYWLYMSTLQICHHAWQVTGK